jgi:hypothetical protein
MDLFAPFPEKPDPASRPILLPLSVDEARAIQAVFAYVGGAIVESPRGFVDSVSCRLIPHAGSSIEACNDLAEAGFEINGDGIYFTSPGEEE